MEAQGEGEVEKRQQGLELVEVVHGRKKVARKGRGRAKREKKCERMEKAQVMEPREDGEIALSHDHGGAKFRSGARLRIMFRTEEESWRRSNGRRKW